MEGLLDVRKLFILLEGILLPFGLDICAMESHPLLNDFVLFYSGTIPLLHINVILLMLLFEVLLSEFNIFFSSRLPAL